MISLTCTSCKTTLEIDDAFAGGVCRCRHCGTIQTVPSTLKKGTRPGAPPGPAGPAAPSKALYQRKPPAPRPAVSDTDEADDDVTPGRRSRAAAPESVLAEAPRFKYEPWQVGVAIGAAAALLIGLIAWLAF